MASAFGARLRRLREAKKLTLQQVADEVGCTKAYIWELEMKDGQRPSAERVQALARVLERWVAHLLGAKVAIQPLPRIDDEHWRWHVGLDAVATSLLNDLYAGREVEPERLQRLTGLFKLEFESPTLMRADVAGRPVYLAMAMDAQGSMRLKPQNLLLNLPLADRS